MKTIFIIICLIVSASGYDFSSNWHNQLDRTWVGENYWAKPLEAWFVKDGKVIARPLHKKEKALHFLDRQLTGNSTLSLEVTINFTKEGQAGFIIASKGNLNEYRHNAIWGKGIHVGISSEGMLHINKEQKKVKLTNKNKATLIVNVTGQGNKKIVLYEKNNPNKKVTLSIPKSKFKGNIALFANSKGNISFEGLKIKGDELVGDDKQQWGPILWTQYTVHNKILKLSAQLVPLGEQDNDIVHLEVFDGEEWKVIQEQKLDKFSSVVLFKVKNWQDDKSHKYRVKYSLNNKDKKKECLYTGVIQKNPVDKPKLKVAGFTCIKDYAFPNVEIVENTKKLDPDMLFFAGDQIYESVGGFNILREPMADARLSYLGKWYLLGWSFGDLLANKPSVLLVDDHDVFHGNVWGSGGKKTDNINKGGYLMPIEWVNMVQRTQTASLPDPYDPSLIGDGVSLYYTDMAYGNVSFAILEDRKYKTGPKFKEKNSKLVLLGKKQLNFIEEWTTNWKDAEMKAVLSATIFAQAHTLSDSKVNKKDYDCNGWPVEGRNKALKAIRKSFSFMCAGDNHLPTLVHHGVDEFEDAGVSFTIPGAAVGYPRAWNPVKAKLKRFPGLPETISKKTKYLGRYKTGFGNKITMLRVANPSTLISTGKTPAGKIDVLEKKSSGFGMITFDKENRTIKIDCFRINAELGTKNAQFDGWPVTIKQTLNYGKKAKFHLPTYKVNTKNAVFSIYKDNELIYSIRSKNNSFQPWVFEEGKYKVIISNPEKNSNIALENIEAKSTNTEEKNISL